MIEKLTWFREFKKKDNVDLELILFNDLLYTIF